jgi:hypothetical protein
MAEEGLGFKFWLWLAGVLILGGIGLFILFLVLGHVFYAWGLFGGFLVLAAVLLLIAWIYDRRQAKQYGED